MFSTEDTGYESLLPTVNELCERLPVEMFQVLDRDVGDLSQWIEIDKQCGCLVGTIAIVCNENNVKSDQLSWQELHRKVFPPIEFRVGAVDSRFISRVRELGAEVPGVAHRMAGRYALSKDGVLTNYPEYKLAAEKELIRLLKDHIREQLRQPHLKSQIKTWCENLSSDEKA